MSTLKQRRCSLFSQNWPNKLLSRILSDPLKITPKPINLASGSQLNMICNKLRRPNSTPAWGPKNPSKSIENRAQEPPNWDKIPPNPLLGPHFSEKVTWERLPPPKKTPQGASKASKPLPPPPSKTHQNRGRNPTKSLLKNDSFLAWILDGFGPRFGRIFGWFFRPNMHENCKNTILAKTLKTSLPSRRNAYFQEIEDRKHQKNQAKSDA